MRSARHRIDHARGRSEPRRHRYTYARLALLRKTCMIRQSGSDLVAYQRGDGIHRGQLDGHGRR